MNRNIQRGEMPKIFIKFKTDSKNTTTTKIAGNELCFHIGTGAKEENASNLPIDQTQINTK